MEEARKLDTGRGDSVFFDLKEKEEMLKFSKDEYINPQNSNYARANFDAPSVFDQSFTARHRNRNMADRCVKQV